MPDGDVCTATRPDWLSPWVVRPGCQEPAVHCMEVMDAWKMIKRISNSGQKTFRYGFAAMITVPEVPGWSIMLQFPKGTNGNFQLWNARFFNFYRDGNSLDVLIQKKWWDTDTSGKNSFTIIAEQLNTDKLRKLKRHKK